MSYAWIQLPLLFVLQDPSSFFQWLLGTVLSSQFSSLVQGCVYMFLTVDKAEASPDWQDFNGP